ncbi:hypothetical protein AMS68_000459 [Peltaster fructicola]|uniref:Uncharacterized protein n=1 Tax=Peltaster fructicola TaxID=286661 RepID=A0A6H0XJP7_9PEZI|nr:hypothetical protein AMS68_000459 [Peltaster fructicola]
MVNKSHPPRNNKGNKKAPINGLNGEDTSFIVFGSDKGNKKGKQQGEQAGPSTKTKASDATSKDGGPEVDKKPDTRTLVAGASWTGKLPMTLFNELCQKQKWERPDYRVHRNPKGFCCEVVISQKNQKTQEIVTLPPLAPPRAYQNDRGAQPSAVEARHFGASYALFRVRNATNIHTTLPPQYRDLWKGDFADLKKEAEALGKGYEYEADPFLAHKKHQDATAAADKAKADKLKQKALEQKLQVVGMDGKVQDKYTMRGWQRVPKVEMGAKTRSQIEHLIRSADLWNVHKVQISKDARRSIVEDLQTGGFRKSHIEEAATICKDKEECLEWLLIHVPEDDLPAWALPENYTAGVSLASSDMRRENQLRRLASAGYAKDLCTEALEAASGDEAKAAAILQQRLLGQKGHAVESSQAVQAAWEEEVTTLQAIFGDRLSKQDQMCTIELELRTPAKRPIVLRARPAPAYPHAVPLLAVETELPAYIRLSILKQCLQHAQGSLLGEQMLFSVVDWLEAEIPAIIESPGKLSDVAAAIATVSITTSSGRKDRQTKRHPRPIVWKPQSSTSQELLLQYTHRQSTTEQQRMLQTRQNLPAWKLQDDIVASVNDNQVTIISGETGSGKSTQSVQFILDDLIKRGLGEFANIICTQPRRISALGLADRVADERCGKVGDEIGYTIRGESRQKTGVTKICFVTTGVLLRRLQTSGGSADDVIKSLADVSHIVIDEVHERSLDTDFLLILLKNVLRKRKDLKLILMSATLDSATFEKYFRGNCTVGKVEIAGRTHPVTDIYLDEIVRATGFGGLEIEAAGHDDEATDRSHKGMGNALRAVGTRINYELIAETIGCIDGELGSEEGGILVFLPGVAEIDQTIRALRGNPGLHVLPLHASLQSSEQRRVFQRPPKGMRKVIAATNVAETSITIDDIVAVIDSGKVKETSFDPANNMIKLAEVWASKAACKQRRGRAGRVRAGKCYKLFTQAAEAKMNDRPEPEIRRVPLEQLCLSVRAMGIIDVASFLASALTPPESTAVGSALVVLNRMGALDGQELTALGRHCSLIPADLRCAKLMVYGAAFGCLDACITIAAVLAVRSPFVSPRDARDEAKAARLRFGGNSGDLLCDLRAYEEWSEKRKELSSSPLRRWCDDNYLNVQTLLDIATNRKQFLSSLKEIGFLSFESADKLDGSTNQHNHDDNLLRALIAGSFQPQIARIDFPDKKYAASSSGAVEMDPEARTIKFFDEENGRVFIHPSSTLFEAQTYPNDSNYMSYFNKMATSKIFVRDLTPFNIYSLLMFSGPITIDPQGRGLLVDGWLRIKGWARIGVLISRLRMMFDDLLAQKVEDPGIDSNYGKIPSNASLKPKPFKAHVNEQKLQHLKDLVRLSPVGPATFENTACGRRYGMERDWLINAKKVWESSFDWRKHEDRINSFPNFTVPVKDDDGVEIELHFIGLFSEKSDAVPVAFFHGWPGSFLEFLDMLDLLKNKYSPKELPYHVIVPSLPGYGYSSAPPLDKDYDMRGAASCLNNLMTGLGFSSYLGQGGDLGAFICRVLSDRHSACKGCHFNMWLGKPDNVESFEMDEVEKKALPRGPAWRSRGFSYAMEHGTRASTIGLALTASPIAMLSWIGEKFLEWSDEDPPVEQILESVSLYWLTDTFERGLYAYRGQTIKRDERPFQANGEYFLNGAGQLPYIKKPTGYSFFPYEIFPLPVSAAKACANIVFAKRHASGGHFAAMEKPKELLADIEEWVPKAWKADSGKL